MNERTAEQLLYLDATFRQVLLEEIDSARSSLEPGDRN
ncbi:hypothetical protein [Alloactinosynnema sp. L-07]|nr:hypothetical protein [Alloactinosynnema sp. L-07]